VCHPYPIPLQGGAERDGKEGGGERGRNEKGATREGGRYRERHTYTLVRTRISEFLHENIVGRERGGRKREREKEKRETRRLDDSYVGVSVSLSHSHVESYVTSRIYKRERVEEEGKRDGEKIPRQLDGSSVGVSASLSLSR